MSTFVAIYVYSYYLTPINRITESQNHRVAQGGGILWSNPLAQPGPPKAGCPGTCPVRF